MHRKRGGNAGVGEAVGDDGVFVDGVLVFVRFVGWLVEVGRGCGAAVEERSGVEGGCSWVETGRSRSVFVRDPTGEVMGCP
jgi:hypothetical protein